MCSSELRIDAWFWRVMSFQALDMAYHEGRPILFPDNVWP